MKRIGQVMSMKIMIVIILILMVICRANGKAINVGGKNFWRQGVNYTLWASQQTFYVQDWLVFRFDKNYYDVLEVNQSNYENCNAKDFIWNVTRGGRDVYELKEAKTYYFICSKGYCWGGMKVAINVTYPQLIAPSPYHTSSSSSLFSFTKSNHLWNAISTLAFLIII